MRRVWNGLPIKVSIKRIPDDIVSEKISRPKNERQGRKREERRGREKSHWVCSKREAIVSLGLRFNFYAWVFLSLSYLIKKQGIAQAQRN